MARESPADTDDEPSEGEYSDGDGESVAPTADSGSAASRRTMMLAIASAILLLPAAPLIVSTEVPAQVVQRLGDELDRHGRPTGGSASANEYNACVSRKMAARLKGPPCKPDDTECLRERSPSSCQRPAALQLLGQGDVQSALSVGSDVEPIRAMLVQRQTLAVANVSGAARGFAAVLGLGLLFGAAAAMSAWSVSRVQIASADEEERAKFAIVALAVAAALALVALVIGALQIAAPGWDHAKLASSVAMVKGGLGMALVAAIVTSVGAVFARKAVLQFRDDE